MQGTQQEIRDIQARLQALNGRDTRYRPPNATSLMVEMFPAQRSQPAPPPSPSRYHFELGRSAEAVPAPRGLPQPAAVPAGRSPAPAAVTGAAVAGAAHTPVQSPPLSPSSTLVAAESATEHAALQQLTQVWQQLEAQAEQVNQLSAAQEAALLELRAIAQRLERDWRATGLTEFPFAATDGDLSALYGPDSAAVPVVERSADGELRVTQRTLELSKAEREAAMMAKVLRQRQHRSHVLTPLGRSVWDWLRGLLAGASTAPKSRRRATAATSVQPATRPDVSLPRAAAWLVGATLARLAIDAVLVSYPAFWLPAVGLIIAPAAIAAYRTTIAPETSIQWGYRLLLIMVGLLLGGRF